VAAEDKPRAIGERRLEDRQEIRKGLLVRIDARDLGRIEIGGQVGSNVIERSADFEHLSDQRDDALGAWTLSDRRVTAGIREDGGLDSEQLAQRAVRLLHFDPVIGDGQAFYRVRSTPLEGAAARMGLSVVADLVAAGNGVTPSGDALSDGVWEDEERRVHPEAVEQRQSMPQL
jgi:hypothetical protein